MAVRTRFDIGSFLFAFGVGDLTVILDDKIFKVRHKPSGKEEMRHSRQQISLADASVSISYFLTLYIIFTSHVEIVWNPGNLGNFNRRCVA